MLTHRLIPQTRTARSITHAFQPHLTRSRISPPVAVASHHRLYHQFPRRSASNFPPSSAPLPPPTSPFNTTIRAQPPLHPHQRPSAVPLEVISITPLIGDEIKSAVVSERRYPVGATVCEDDIIATIESGKVAIDIPSPIDGTIRIWHKHEGDQLHSGTPLVSIEPTPSAIQRAHFKEMTRQRNAANGIKPTPSPSTHSSSSSSASWYRIPLLMLFGGCAGLLAGVTGYLLLTIPRDITIQHYRDECARFKEEYHNKLRHSADYSPGLESYITTPASGVHSIEGGLFGPVDPEDRAVLASISPIISNIDGWMHEFHMIAALATRLGIKETTLNFIGQNLVPRALNNVLLPICEGHAGMLLQLSEMLIWAKVNAERDGDTKRAEVLQRLSTRRLREAVFLLTYAQSIQEQRPQDKDEQTGFRVLTLVRQLFYIEARMCLQCAERHINSFDTYVEDSQLLNWEDMKQKDKQAKEYIVMKAELKQREKSYDQAIGLWKQVLQPTIYALDLTPDAELKRSETEHEQTIHKWQEFVSTEVSLDKAMVDDRFTLVDVCVQISHCELQLGHINSAWEWCERAMLMGSNIVIPEAFHEQIPNDTPLEAYLKSHPENTHLRDYLRLKSAEFEALRMRDRIIVETGKKKLANK